MKYRTFTRLRAGVVALVAAGAAFVGCRAVTTPQAPSPDINNAVPITDAQSVAPEQASNQAPSQGAVKPSQGNKSAPQATAGSEPLTEWQQEVMNMQKQPLSNGDLKSGSYKWVVNGGGMRAEFRSDADKGSKAWNRVKVDLNRNKRFEERWDFKSDGSIKRRVSPNDDENYTEEWNLKGQTWVRRK